MLFHLDYPDPSPKLTFWCRCLADVVVLVGATVVVPHARAVVICAEAQMSAMLLSLPIVRLSARPAREVRRSEGGAVRP